MFDQNANQLQIHERNIRFHLKKAYDFYTKYYFDRALQELERALLIAPGHPVVTYYRGIVYGKLKNYEQAIRDFDVAAPHIKNRSNFHQNRAEAHYCLKNYEAGIADADKAIEFDPNNTSALTIKGRCISELGDNHAALELFNVAVAREPNNADWHLQRAIALTRLDNYQEALAAYDKSIAINPNIPNAIYFRASVRHKLGDSQGAESDLAQCRNMGMAVYSYLPLPVPKSNPTPDGHNP